MSLIITATDFSEIANNAVHYACAMATGCNARVTIVHSFAIPVTFTDNPMPLMPIDEGKEVAEESMSLLVSKLSLAYPGLLIDSHITFGDITSSLDEYAEKHEPSFIVIGNSSSDEAASWWGSNLLSEIRELKYPVIAVPAGYSYKAVNKICFACDLKHFADKMPLDDLMNLVGSMNADLHILNVDNTKETGMTLPAEASALQQQLIAVNAQYHYMESENIDEGIQKFVEANSMDWLVVTPHNYSFFEGLFHKSHTKEMLRRIHVPVIALHETK